MSFEKHFDKILNFYEVSTIKDLSSKINTGASTISNWKQRNSIPALKKKCRELGIYDKIFNNLNNDTSNTISINKILLEKAEIEASRFGLDINSYLEHLIIQDLKKEKQ